MTVKFQTLQEAGHESLPSFLDMVDEEFLRGKARSGSVLERYPGLFSAENFANLHSAWYDDQLAGALAVKKFEFATDGKTIDAAMLGFVCVNPKIRGQGIGSKLVERVTRTLASEKIAFSVLWTTRPDFYQRFGWTAGDRGVIGELFHPPRLNVEVEKFDLSDSWREIEEIRSKWQEQKVLRTQSDYEVLPCPVSDVFSLIQREGNHSTAYAIVGVNGRTGIVYEFVGETSQFAPVWSHVCSCFDRILVNDCAGTSSHKWLSQHTNLAWKNQKQAMWMSGTEAGSIGLEQLYVPYFDRI